MSPLSFLRSQSPEAAFAAAGIPPLTSRSAINMHPMRGTTLCVLASFAVRVVGSPCIRGSFVGQTEMATDFGTFQALVYQVRAMQLSWGIIDPSRSNV